MHRQALALVAFVLLSSTAIAQDGPAIVNGRVAAPDATPVVHIGVFSYLVDGRQTGGAWDELKPTGESIVYATRGACGLGAGNRLPDTAPDAWRFEGEVLRATKHEAVVRLAWQRMRAGGVEVSSPRDSLTMTLRTGERVVLDSIAAGTPTCKATHAAFEARYEPSGFARREQ